jgi:hypothetical protein
MKSEDPDDPQAWLSRARSNLKLAEKGGQSLLKQASSE